MTAPLPANIARVPGRLILTPTSLSTSAPHGGTYLGVTRDQELRVGAKYHMETAEEWGGAPARVFYVGSGKAVFACVMRSFDKDAMALLPETSTGAVTQDTSIAPDVNSDSTRAGRSLSGSLIMFSPIALETQPVVILYNAVPMWDEAARLQLSIKAEMAPALMFACMPDSQGRTYFVGKIADGSL